MTATGRIAEPAPIADPAARQLPRNDGEWRIWLGWAAAAMLHGALLAALIFSWPARLNPAPPNPAVVSLLIVHSEKPGRQPAVRPKPAEAPIAAPPTPPAIIANSPAANRPKPPSALPRASARSLQPALKQQVLKQSALKQSASTQSAPRGAVETKTVPQQDGDGFVAAQPVAGNVNQPPEYPEEAYDHGEQGSVLLSIHVLANGEADSVSVTQSSGYRTLDEAAAQAVSKWRFEPSTLSGHSVPSVIPYRIHFNLQNAP
jgi:protein TonB